MKLFTLIASLIIVTVGFIFYPIVIASVLVATVIYLLATAEMLKPNEIAGIALLGSPWRSVTKTKFCVVLKPFEKLYRFPAQPLSVNLVKEKLLCENEIEVTVDPMLKLKIIEPHKALRLGSNYDEILQNIFETKSTSEENGRPVTRWEGGRVGEIIAESIRVFFLTITDEKEAQKKRGGDVGFEIHKKDSSDPENIVDAEYSKEEFGIDWQGLILNDVEMPESIKNAEVQKREAEIKKGQAKAEADIQVKLSRGKLKSLELFTKSVKGFEDNPEAAVELAKLMFVKEILDGKPGEINLFSGDISNLIPAKLLGGK